MPSRTWRRAPDVAFIHLALTRDGETSYNELFLTEPKRIRLSRARVTPTVTAEVPKERGRRAGSPSASPSDAPAFYVALDAGEIAGEFSDNSFTLLPGTPRTVHLPPAEKG